MGGGAVLVWMAMAAVWASAFGWIVCAAVLERLEERRRIDKLVRLFPGNDGDRRFGDSTPKEEGRFARALRRKASLSQRRRAKERLEIQKHIPEMVDAVALGMRAGLSFESAFELSCVRFDDVLSRKCRRAHACWESGLVSRDAALRALAEEMDVPVMTRFVGNVIRCLRYGSPMSRVFESVTSEARSCYRSQMEEVVAKAPVKMLMPTAGLILPAMLIVVMGPVLLEFV